MRTVVYQLPPKTLLINLLPVQFTTLRGIDDDDVDDDTMSSLLIRFLGNIRLLGRSLHGIPHG
jgi:hypothetical protein